MTKALSLFCILGLVERGNVLSILKFQGNNEVMVIICMIFYRDFRSKSLRWIGRESGIREDNQLRDPLLWSYAVGGSTRVFLSTEVPRFAEHILSFSWVQPNWKELHRQWRRHVLSGWPARTGAREGLLRTHMCGRYVCLYVSYLREDLVWALSIRRFHSWEALRALTILLPEATQHSRHCHLANHMPLPTLRTPAWIPLKMYCEMYR